MEKTRVNLTSLLMIVIMVLAGLYMSQNSWEVEGLDEIAPPSRDGPVTFTNVSQEVGLSHLNGNYFSWGDFDNDDHQDLLVNGKKLFRNSGPPDYMFTDVTDHAGIDRPVNSGIFGDYDNDGWLDIFCGGGYGSRDHPDQPDILWHNNRDGTFSDVTMTAGGLSDTFPTVAGGWSDIDRDGNIDLFMINYENANLSGYPNHFWFNNGDGTFTNGTRSSGMDESDDPLPGRGVSFTDFDNDGFMDAYFSNYRIMRNYLYRNLRNGTMEEVGSLYGVQGHEKYHPITQEGPYYGHSLGSSWGDLDNDGDMDLWVTNLAHKDALRGPLCDDSNLFENLGPDDGYSFLDIRGESGIPVKEIPGALIGDGDELMVSSALADYDNDGDLDLFLPQIYNNIEYAYSYLYSNDGDMTFTDVSSETGIRVWNTYGSAWCDYNEDGWIDLITGGGDWDPALEQTVNSAIHLYRNNGASEEPDRKWLEVDLTGRSSNNAAIGSRVTVSVDKDGDGAEDFSMIREVNGGTAAHGQQDSMVLHFGLGDQVGHVSVTVQWPMGRSVMMNDVKTNTILKIFEPTEDIILNLTITDIVVGEQRTEITLDVFNPTIYTIPYSEVVISIEDNGDIREVTIFDVGEISPGPNTFELEGQGIAEGIQANITISILRSYPPLREVPVAGFHHDPLTNHLPVALITGPSNVEVGVEFEVDASDSFDKDGSIGAYNFDMGDGTVSGWQASSSFEHEYSEKGTYVVHLSVKDDMGGMSIEDGILTIIATGSKDPSPLAVIDYIRDEESEPGDRVRFKGHGVPSEGRTIVSYEWGSSIDGNIGNEAYLSLDDLSPGDHVISFRVQDSAGDWSHPATGGLVILENVQEDLWVSIDPISLDGPLTGVIEISGGSGPIERVEYVEVRIDSGTWSRTRTVPEWSYELDCSELEAGTHRIDARAFGDRYYSNQYASMEFEIGEDEEIPLENNMERKDRTFMDILQEMLVAVIIGGGLFFVGILALIFIILLMVRKRREIRMARSGSGLEDTPKYPESFLPEQNDGDIQIVQATIIE